MENTLTEMILTPIECIVFASAVFMIFNYNDTCNKFVNTVENHVNTKEIVYQVTDEDDIENITSETYSISGSTVITDIKSIGKDATIYISSAQVPEDALDKYIYEGDPSDIIDMINLDGEYTKTCYYDDEQNISEIRYQ